MNFTLTPLTGFPQYLFAEGLFAEAQLQELADQARAEEMPFSLYLLNRKWLEPIQLASAMSRFYAIPLYDLDAHSIDKMPIEFMSLDIVQKGFALPLLRRRNTLYLGVIDPALIKPDEITFATGVEVKLIAVESDKMRILTNDVREAQDFASLQNISETALSDLDVTSSQGLGGGAFSFGAEDKPTVAYINQLLLEAVRIKASDIHFEPFEKYFRIRYRVDGVLYEVAQISMQAATPLLTRLKVLADLDIAERRVPQDGRFKIILSQNKTIDFRVSVCPTIFGEKVVLRILDPDTITLDITALGMEKEQQDIYLKAVREPQGIILVTGPTGSGKTVSLYTAINLLNSVEDNICTIEDPIEIYMPGVNQVHMNEKTGMTFERAIRAFLRQDPDIIMVGEIRDFDTADIAIKAAQTGHLVLSTVHTNDAASTVARLVNIGLQPYNIASSLTLVIAQRLVRKLCRYCKKPAKIPKDVLLSQGITEKELDLTFYEARKCEKCSNGYKGRVGIFELMPVSPAIRNMILHGSDLTLIKEQARKEGMITLREAGLSKIKAGITTFEELNRVVSSAE